MQAAVGVLGFAALGVLVACGGERSNERACAPGWDPRTAWLAADRDGNALVELDEDLFVVGVRELPHPLWVRTHGAHVWVVHAPQGSPDPPLSLRAWGAAGPGPAREVGEVLGLEVEPSGSVLVLERARGGGARLTRHDAAGGACDLAAPQGAVALALGPQGAGLALGDRGWASLGPEGTWVVRDGLERGSVLDLAPRAEGGWWTLLRWPGEPESLCVAIDGAGVPVEVRHVGSARRLSRRGGRPWAWEGDGRTIHGGGAQPIELSSRGSQAAVGDGDGGLLCAAAGAILRVDAAGAARPGQGGFARLVDLERLSPPRPLRRRRRAGGSRTCACAATAWCG